MPNSQPMMHLHTQFDQPKDKVEKLYALRHVIFNEKSEL